MLTLLLSLTLLAVPTSLEDSAPSATRQEAATEPAAGEWRQAIERVEAHGSFQWEIIPVFRLLPEIGTLRQSNRGASSGGDPGVEAPLNHTGAVVRYSEYPSLWRSFDGSAPEVGKFAPESGSPKAFGFYAEYDARQRLTRLVEFDALLRGNIELDECRVWDDGLPRVVETRWPYSAESRRIEFQWSEDSRLLALVKLEDGVVVERASFSYEGGLVSGRVDWSVLEDKARQLGSYSVDRDGRGRICKVEYSSNAYGRSDRVVYFRYPTGGGVQRLWTNQYGDLVGRHWQRLEGDEELVCSFKFRLRDGEPFLEGTRSRRAGRLSHVESFLAPHPVIPGLRHAVDPEILLTPASDSQPIRLLGALWPEERTDVEHGYNEPFIFSSDERGNWLEAGYIDPETGERRVTHARTIEYL